MSFAENLIRARKLAHLSQQQLAQRSNVSQQAISKLESGKSSPSEYTIKQLAAALRMPAADLISDDKKIPIAESDGLMQEIITRIQSLLVFSILSDPFRRSTPASIRAYRYSIIFPHK